MCQSKVINTSTVGNVDQIVHELDVVKHCHNVCDSEYVAGNV